MIRFPLSRKGWILLAGGGSAALLAGAFAFQHLGGMAPCKLCLWQRWPHGAAILLAMAAFALPVLALILAGAVAALSTAAIGLYHSGVEQGWWQGPSTCTAAPIDGLTPQQLLEQIMATPMVRCDDIPWQMLGLSMASWNAIASLCFALCWIMAARAR